MSQNYLYINFNPKIFGLTYKNMIFMAITMVIMSMVGLAIVRNGFVGLILIILINGFVYSGFFVFERLDKVELKAKFSGLNRKRVIPYGISEQKIEIR